MEFFKAIVTEIHRETADASRICFDAERTYGKNPGFKPGQHITLRVVLDGVERRRSYSLCSLPGEAKACIAVKAVPNGLVSNWLHRAIRPGSTFECSLPEGHFTLLPDPERRHHHYFIAAGSGITPVLPMISSLLESEPRSTVYLLYGNRNEESILFYERLRELEGRHAGQFFSEYTLSRPSKSLLPFLRSARKKWQGWTGRIGAELLDAFLHKYPPPGQTSSFYLCGPGQMIEDIKSGLDSRGFEAGNIHAEYFTAPPKPDVPLSSPAVEHVHVTVHLSGKKHEVDLSGDQKILDGLLTAGIDAPYSCCSGACSTCMARLISGQVHMDTALALEQEDLDAGYILTCQSRPLTPQIEIVFP